MSQYRSGTNYSSANRVVGDVSDNGTNTIISTGVGFGDSPLAEHVVAQIKYGVTNGQFNLFPPDASSPLGETNKLPFWDVIDLCDTPGAIEASLTTTDGGATYGVTINPTGAIIDDQIVIRTRVPVLTDTNLAVRQKLVSSLTKSAVYSGANQWDLVVSAEYFTHSNDSLSYLAIGTASHNQTWTQIGGTTTPGGSAISSSASYCDITYTLTATTTVTDTTTVTINSCLLATSEPTTGGFLVVERYDSSATWTRPTGVEYLQTLIAVGGGGGGGGGGIFAQSDNSSAVVSAPGGGGGGFLYVTDIYIGDNATYAIGVGAGGIGGAAATATKAAGVTAAIAATGTAGTNGGASTFGSKAIATGGGGGSGGIGITNSSPLGTSGGAAGGGSPLVWDRSAYSSGRGGYTNGVGTGNNAFDANPGSMESGGYTAIPLALSYPAAGTAGAAGGGGTMTGNSFTGGGTGGAEGYFCGGGGTGGSYVSVSSTDRQPLAPSAGRSAGGGGGGLTYRASTFNTAGTYTVLAGAGGNAALLSGSGGGGGGGIWINTIGSTPTVTLTAGSGGNGGGGFVIIAYIA